MKIEVDVAGDIAWFSKHGEYPVMVEVEEEKIQINTRVYRRYHGPNGVEHIARERGVYVGTVSPDGVSPTLSKAARKTLLVARAAVFALPYRLVVGYKVGLAHIHVGECWVAYAATRGPKLTLISLLYDVKSNKRCRVCGKAWEL